MKLHRTIKIFFLPVFFFFAVSTLPVRAFGDEPMDQVKQTIETVREIFRDKELKKPENREKRDDLLKETVGKRFDFEEMTKRSLALHWRKRTSEERKEFISLYSDLLETTYLRKIERYEQEDIEKHVDDKVLYNGEEIDGPYASVKTTIVTYKGTQIPVEYRLHKVDGQWKAYDIVIEGVSLINNYRTQFNQIIRSDSYEELVKRLKEKVEKEK